MFEIGYESLLPTRTGGTQIKCLCVLQGAMLVDLVNHDLLPTPVWTTVCYSVHMIMSILFVRYTKSHGNIVLMLILPMLQGV